MSVFDDIASGLADLRKVDQQVQDFAAQAAGAAEANAKALLEAAIAPISERITALEEGFAKIAAALVPQVPQASDNGGAGGADAGDPAKAAGDQ